MLSENANEAAERRCAPFAEFVFGITPERSLARVHCRRAMADANTKRVEAQQWTARAAVCVFIKSPRPGFLHGLLFLCIERAPPPH